MSGNGSLQSILKQSSDQSVRKDELKAKVERDRKNLKIAYYHACKINDQKKFQFEILNRLEDLIDLPYEAPFSARDARHFTSAVQIFQPSDLDDLIDERRIESRCGYVLCSNAPRTDHVPTWKVGKGSANYCTNVCMKKMLYIKTQLCEIPAWERGPREQQEIVLHDDDRDELGITGRPTELRRKLVKADDEELAFERGETKASFRPKQVMTDRIVEKAVTERPQDEKSSGQTSYRAIEGYEPKNKSKKQAKLPSFEEPGSEDDD
nr:hypothetical protein CFP56_11142 [Quercus suber]